MKLPKDMTGMLVLAGIIGVGGFIMYRAFGKRDEQVSSASGGSKWTPQWKPQPQQAINWGENTSDSSAPYGIPQDTTSFDTSDMSLVPDDLEFSGARGRNIWKKPSRSEAVHWCMKAGSSGGYMSTRPCEAGDEEVFPEDVNFSGASGYDGEVVEHYVKPLWTV